MKYLNVFRKKMIFLLVLMVASVHMFAQEKNITGKVIDIQNEGIPGVIVQIKGTSKGITTDVDGNYSISVPNSKSILAFSYVGFVPQEVSVGNQSNISIQLLENTQLLDEVVVVGYGNMRKSDLTGATTTISPDSKDANKAISLDNLLSGKIAGLSVSSSSATGAASSVTIRGASSLRGDNQPLYVIDNIPQSSAGEFSGSGVSGDFQIAQDPLSSLNPNDIESITVLKDASSTAIYGSRGANGVILITTKKGKSGKAKVMVSATFTIADATRLLKMMNLEQYGRYMNSKVANPDDLATVQYHFDNNEVRYVFNNALGNYDANNPETYRVLEYRDWQKEIYHSAFSQSYSVAVNGGSDKTTYYVSANFKDIKGTTKQTGIQQGDLRATLNAQLSNTVKMTLTTNGSIRKNDMMAGGNTLGGSSGAVSRAALDSYPFIAPKEDPTLETQAQTNIDVWLTDYIDKADDKTFKASLDLSWKPFDFLTYSLRTGGNLNINERKRWWGMGLYQGMNNNGYLSISNLSKNNISVDNVVNYNSKIGKIGTIDAVAAITYEDYKYLNKNTLGTQFSVFNLKQDGMHMAKEVTIQEPTQSDYQLLSYLGRVNFNFLEKYLVTGSLRADGSSKFAAGNKWGCFPSGSVAWRIEQEDFMKNVTFLDQLKLRTSFGVTGNQSISPYSTFSMYGNDNIIYGDGSGDKETSLVVTNLPNYDLTWEKTASWNVGLDFSLFRSRLSGTIDWYSKKTTDLLISRNLPGSAGFGSTYYNQGDLTNEGIEFSLNAQIIDSKDWKWNVAGNISVNRAIIGDLGVLPSEFGALGGERIGYYGNSLGDHFGVGHVFLQGGAPGLFFGYVTQGIVQTDDVTSQGIRYQKDDGSEGYYKTSLGLNPKAGDIKYVDQNGDGIVDQNDRDIIGDPNPNFTYGFQSTVSWRKLSLSATFQGVQGKDILNLNNRYVNTPGLNTGGGLPSANAFENMWTSTNPSNLFPGSTSSISNIVMDRYVESGSYLRCSDITLGYVLPLKLARKIGSDNISVYASVKNAFIITDYSGYDPEVNMFAFDGLRPGVDLNSYPNSRSFIFGLNVTF